MLATMTDEPKALNDEACWQAVLDRRATADGVFVYAVRTTGVYCRPTCASRRPRRDNVRFFATSLAAEGAGFRACRRCAPSSPARREVMLVRRICRAIEKAERPPSLAELSAEFSLSPFQLQRTFKRVTGVTPKRYAETRRLTPLKRGLREERDIAAATYGAGFGSSSRLYERAAARLGMTPGAYRRGGAGMRIAYTIVSCDFGRMLVGATDRGVSSVTFGDDDRTLEAILITEYHAAEIVRDDAALRPRVDAVLRNIDGASAELPLDIRATAFQVCVWDALTRIPRGETRSYAEIAREIGRPTAARAVASACRQNPIAAVIPCHRVVHSGGGPGGYRWGLARKAALQAKERGE